MSAVLAADISAHGGKFELEHYLRETPRAREIGAVAAGDLRRDGQVG